MLSRIFTISDVSVSFTSTKRVTPFSLVQQQPPGLRIGFLASFGASRGGVVSGERPFNGVVGAIRGTDPVFEAPGGVPIDS